MTYPNDTVRRLLQLPGSKVTTEHYAGNLQVIASGTIVLEVISKVSSFTYCIIISLGPCEKDVCQIWFYQKHSSI
jgi:hypothetical protein